MQIRLTVVDPLGQPSEPQAQATACDVLVTAPSGTALAAVAPGLAAAVGGAGGASPAERGREPGTGPVVLYAGAERLDTQRCTLGEPPLTDGAVLSLGAPAEPGPEVDESAPRLHVVAGPDAGGVHFLHGGKIRVGRSAEADVPLDDPDVSRLHCTVTVVDDGRVWVADIGSTNGTTLDGTRVGDRPVRFPSGSLLRIGESALRLAAPGAHRMLETAPDGEGYVRVTLRDTSEHTPAASSEAGSMTRTGAVPHARGEGGSGSGANARGAEGSGTAPPASPAPGSVAAGTAGPAGACGHASGPAHLLAAQDTGAAGTTGAGTGMETAQAASADGEYGAAGGAPGPGGTRKGTPVRGLDAPRGPRKRGGLTAWARRLAGGRGDRAGGGHDPYDVDEDLSPRPPAGLPQAPETWPDPAALLLTALGPGPRLWEREPGHPELLAVRLGTADRTAPDGSGLLPAVPVTTGLREVGALGLAGPRARLTGLARAVVAQLAALHSPDILELVLISADRSRSVAERTADWSWLGWLPHVRPGHGQDCRLLLAYDHEQATARTDELLRRLEDHTSDTASAPAPSSSSSSSAGRDGAPPPVNPGFPGPYTVVLVDGDPGGTDVRETVARLALEGPAAGIHVICLAETEAASPVSPVTETYEDACAASPVFRACGAVALLSGDVATALRLMRVAPARPTAPHRQPVPAEHTRAADGDRPGHRVGRDRPGSGSDATTAPAGGHRADGAPAGVPRPRSGRSVPHAHADAGRTNPTHVGLAGHPPAGGPEHTHAGAPGGSGPVTPGTVAAVDAVSAEWAERFARSLAPLRPGGALGEPHARVSAPLPQSARLLDELGLARATPASLLARWADAADDPAAVGGRAWAVLGAGPRGPVSADLVADGPHLLIEGPSGSGRTELLRSVAASLAAAERPDRLGIALVEGRDGGGHDRQPGDGLGVCTDLPHVGTHITANDPVRMREFAQSLSTELKRRAELVGRLGFGEWHTSRGVPARLVAQRTAPGTANASRGASFARTGSVSSTAPARGTSTAPARGTSTGAHTPPSSPPPATGPGTAPGAADIDTAPSTTIRLRPAANREHPEPGPPLARLVVIVDDLDALLAPPLGSPGRPAAGSVVRALEAVAREGARLGVHLVAATAGGDRTAETDLARAATLRVTLEAPASGPDEPAAGRGRLAVTDPALTPAALARATLSGPSLTTAPPAGHPAALTTGPVPDPIRSTPFQAGRVTGRIPRTATLRPTVVPLDWARMGDPPARRPVRELGNGPTDLALLASALDRAARSVSAKEVPSLI